MQAVDLPTAQPRCSQKDALTDAQGEQRDEADASKMTRRRVASVHAGPPRWKGGRRRGQITEEAGPRAEGTWKIVPEEEIDSR